MKAINILVKGLFLVLIISCNSESEKVDKVDKKQVKLFLTNMVNNNILPAFTNFDDELNNLNSSFETFSQSANAANLTAVKEAYLKTAISWQKTGLYEGGSGSRIGPSVGTYLVRFVNIFPTHKETIDEIVGLLPQQDSKDYSLSNYKIQGLPALDLLLYDSSVDVLSEFTGANATKRIAHVKAILSQMIAKNNTVLSQWKEQSDSFIANTSSAANGSFNKLLNAFSEYYEQKIRKAKLGGPLGKFTQGVVREKDIEALYSKQSKQLLIAANTAAINFYEGNYGLNLKKLLEESKVESNGKLLSVELSNRLKSVQDKLALIPDTDFEVLVKNNDTSLNEAYKAFQQVVALFKIEVIPAFDGQINYTDSDGD